MDGSIVFARRLHLVHNRHPHRTSAAPCRVALSISTADVTGSSFRPCWVFHTGYHPWGIL